MSALELNPPGAPESAEEALALGGWQTALELLITARAGRELTLVELDLLALPAVAPWGA